MSASAFDSETQNSKLKTQNSFAIALLGNPNTGKTTLFNALAGMNQRVGNYPGVTVETKKGRMTVGGATFELVDLPGTYSLAPRSPDEMVAVDLVLGQQAGEPKPDAVLSIVDASNLERNLYLTTQALELGVPVVLALNMIDVAEAQGIRLDVERLSKQFGVPVVPIQANRGKGLDRLKQVLFDAVHVKALESRMPHVPFPAPFEKEVIDLHEHIGGHVSPFLIRRLLLDVGGYTETRLSSQHHDLPDDVTASRRRLAEAGCGVPAVEARTRYGWIRQMTAGCVERPKVRPVTWTDRLDRVLTHRIFGTLIFLVMMFVIFEAIFLIADPAKSVIDLGKTWLADGVRSLLPAGPLTDLLSDGVIEGVGSVIVFVPQIVILFGFIAVLEDCGYMARAAFLMDRLMSRCGLSGKSFIPMLSSVACAVPGIMATRVIENRRDRLATILTAPLMSCSARLPVYSLLIGAFLPIRNKLHPDGYGWWVQGVAMFAMYSIGLIVAPLVALLLKRTLLRGETPVFVMEMPLYKWPSWRTIMHRMRDAGWAFLRRAGTLILAAMVVVWALLYFPRALPEPLTLEFADPESGEISTTTVTTYPEQVALVKEQVERIGGARKTAAFWENIFLGVQQERLESESNELAGEWQRQSLLGHAGRAIAPAVKPLGWDWRIGMAALASFPAREVVVGTLGIIYNEGKVESDEMRKTDEVADTKLGKRLRGEFGLPTALSLMVFFALCCQCASTLVVIRRETNSWRWPVFTFVYMTSLAYVAALVVYQTAEGVRQWTGS
jgi:ferrous iron transport protein B